MAGLFLSVKNREETVYNGEILTMTSYNGTGKFDILMGHANFISLINKKILIHEINGAMKEIPLESGVLRIKNNMIEVYLGVKS
jgi:F0F1-type ATP synthase epsilon subunit